MNNSVSEKIKIGALENFNKELITLCKNKKIFILCDQNTKQCVDYLINKMPFFSIAHSITIKPGENSKTIKTAEEVWNFLSYHNANRNDLLINIGGGLITDIGGFVASTYKRGLSFINISTSLLGMVDASIGGKTGLNFNKIKNQIGVFSQPELIICDPFFLKSLPNKEFISGFAEVLKHGLVYNKKYWNYCNSSRIEKLEISKIIKDSIKIKNEIVRIDPKEKKERKLLNFGHTIGHAIEALSLKNNKTILHGFAVAIGIKVESYISYELNLLKEKDYLEIKHTIENIFPKQTFLKTDISELLDFMKNDKKNNSTEINFTLIKEIGVGVINQNLEEKQVKLLLEKYIQSS